MEAAIAATKALLDALNCRPEDENYAARFKEIFDEERRNQREAEERKRADAAEERRLQREAEAEERKRADAAEERRLQREAEAEERKRADAAEEKRLQREAEEKRLEREHELAMAEHRRNANTTLLNNSAPPNDPPPRSFVDVLPFTPQNERADRFIQRFEAVLGREKVPEGRYAENFLKALPPVEAAPFLQLPVDDQFNYKILKETFLRRHRVTETQLRDDFRNVRPAKEDTATAFARTLQRTFDYWVEATNMAKTFDDLRDRLIADQLTDLLPNHLLIHLRENKARTVENITSLLDAYFEARPQQGLHLACQGAHKAQGGSKPSTNTKQGATGTRASPPSNCDNTTQQQTLPSRNITPSAAKPTARSPPNTAAPSSNGRNPAASSPKGCLHHGAGASHTSDQCYVLHPEKRPTSSSGAEQDTTNWRQPMRLTTPPRTANVAITTDPIPIEGPAPEQTES